MSAMLDYVITGGSLFRALAESEEIHMLSNIDINKMNRLMKENTDAKQIISQLLENHHTIVSMISHEIRNPLTLISSSLQVMEKQHPEVKDFYNWEQTMEDVNFMCDLLNDLSSFNNSSTIHYSVFPIDKLLKNVAVSFAIALDARGYDTVFTSRIAPDMGDFTGDKIKLEEVILNLLKNAREATDGKGHISLTAERTKDDIIIRCQDDGCGIPEDIMDTIFDPFVTYKENGTGLGLSSAKRIIEAHGGILHASSSPETGTIFTVTLPV